MSIFNKLKNYAKIGVLFLVKMINHLIPFASVFNTKIQMKIQEIKKELELFGKKL